MSDRTVSLLVLVVFPCRSWSTTKQPYQPSHRQTSQKARSQRTYDSSSQKPYLAVHHPGSKNCLQSYVRRILHCTSEKLESYVGQNCKSTSVGTVSMQPVVEHDEAAISVVTPSDVTESSQSTQMKQLVERLDRLEELLVRESINYTPYQALQLG